MLHFGSAESTSEAQHDHISDPSPLFFAAVKGKRLFILAREMLARMSKVRTSDAPPSLKTTEEVDLEV